MLLSLRSSALALTGPHRRAVSVRALVLAVIASTPSVLGAQSRADTTATADTTPAPRRPAHYWRSVFAGFATSLLAHESAHVLTAIAVGGRPTIGVSKGRPTVYSGLSADSTPSKQFLFSSMGLNVQALLDETILDVPHARGAPFERGVLLGGIATTFFYVTIGRTASVSDVDFMARTSSLSKSDITVIYGGLAMLHVLRIHRDARYAHFFMRPSPVGQHGLRVGVNVQ
ncbi:MAG: hypothetical protein ABI601_05430 [bacterium]